MDITIYKKNH